MAAHAKGRRASVASRLTPKARAGAHASEPPREGERAGEVYRDAKTRRYPGPGEVRNNSPALRAAVPTGCGGSQPAPPGNGVRPTCTPVRAQKADTWKRLAQRLACAAAWRIWKAGWSRRLQSSAPRRPASGNNRGRWWPARSFAPALAASGAVDSDRAPLRRPGPSPRVRPSDQDRRA